MKNLIEALIGKHNISNSSSLPDYKNLKKIVNFTYNDLFDVGNIIEFEENGHMYHGIVIPSSVAANMFNIYSSVILTPQDNKHISYWKAEYFQSNWPKSGFASSAAKIVKVYRFNKDISKLYTAEDFYNLFMEYGLKFIKRRY